MQPGGIRQEFMHRHSSKQVTSPTEMEMNALNAYWSPTLDCDHEKDYTKEGKVLCYYIINMRKNKALL